MIFWRRKIAKFNPGDALWQMRLFVGHIEIIILSVSMSNPNAIGRPLYEDARAWTSGTCMGLVPELRGTSESSHGEARGAGAER